MKAMSRYTKDIHEAEDVFAEAISIFWIKHKQGKLNNTENIPAYVFTIAKNLLLTKKRKEVNLEDIAIYKNNKQLLVEDLKMFEEPSENEKLLKKAFDQLGTFCQEILTMKYVYKYSYEEIAEQTGRKSGDSLKTQSYRCMKKLRTLMKTI